jgi:hypothetical protein
MASVDKWNIVFARGATYTQTITVTGVANIATATEWRIRCAFPNEPEFLLATTNNGLMIAGATTSQKVLVVPAATTALFDLGNARFDFEVAFPDGSVSRYISNGLCQINPEVGA